MNTVFTGCVCLFVISLLGLKLNSLQDSRDICAWKQSTALTPDPTRVRAPSARSSADRSRLEQPRRMFETFLSVVVHSE